jgi:hypothetical protein
MDEEPAEVVVSPLLPLASPSPLTLKTHPKSLSKNKESNSLSGFPKARNLRKTPFKLNLVLPMRPRE